MAVPVKRRTFAILKEPAPSMILNMISEQIYPLFYGHGAIMPAPSMASAKT